MMRSLASILAGAAVWAAGWIAFTQSLQAAFPSVVEPDGALRSLPALIALNVVSLALSVAAGYVTGLVARRAEVGHAFALGILQLALGLQFQISAWSLFPVWYHLVFLSLLIPGNVYGGWLRRGQRGTTGQATRSPARA